MPATTDRHLPSKIEDPNRINGVLPGMEGYYSTKGYRRAVMKFPETPRETAPFSNLLSRVPVFVPVRPGRRKVLQGKQLASPEGTKVVFSGTQLNIADQDLFLAILEALKGSPAGSAAAKTGSEWLRCCGWNSLGTPGYKFLKASLGRLYEADIYIKAKLYEARFRLISEYGQTGRSSKINITLSNHAMALFHNDEYSYINLRRRNLLQKRKEMAKFIQCYACGHAKGEHTTTVEDLHEMMDSGTRMNDFTRSLAEALAELKRVGEFTTFKIKGHFVSWFRPGKDFLPPYGTAFAAANKPSGTLL